MSEQKRRPRQDTDETQGQPQPEQAKAKRTEKVSSVDEILDEIDEAIKAGLGFDENEEVSREALDEAAENMVRQYVQKGGQ